ncbi:Retrovirus-related Pol polyprotein from transposon 412,Retrovirus-related Pol polyprotein from transposon 297 [Mytilus edulis]|uniref:Retrovirus-related Pol polyprotein from transposon 412,Retrovirus-related Pol polyprotein from transposon 297 n=1 Tax=Mytilus edulis TaxID=6550 RepID=A0A8S3STZ0_MYTED|nr:Retrovirus-related Pol polyprotein from transposon 412,Retrovirus-related Pol polyprotein from transposon 297 [Mytilus edulis]
MARLFYHIVHYDLLFKLHFAWFKENADAKTDKIKAVTILYEEMTIERIVGGVHYKYYTLSCLGKVGVVQAEMIQMTVGKPGQNEEKTTLKGALHLTISTVNSKLVDHTMEAKIGEKLSLSITSPGNSWFSTLDCCSGYWQVELAEKDKHKTAFATRKGLFQFKVMPFGLCCAAQTFERLMETVLAGLQWEVCLVYLDDIIVFGKTLDDMLVNLRTVFDRLKSAGLKLKAKKCNLCVTMVRYLGHIISEDGIATDPEKIKVVQNWPVPTNPTEVRSFLGLCSYYRKFIKNFASIAKCLHVLTEKGKRFEWISDCQHAFDLLKLKLTNAPILTHPDFNKEFILDTDAKRIIYSSLRWVLNFKNPEGQVARLIETLSAYDMYIQHRPGTQHRNADALSRVPCKQCGNTLDWQSKTSIDCHKTEESQVKIVTSQMPDHDRDWTLTDIQGNDQDLKLIKQWLTDGQSYNEVSGKGFFIRSLWSQFNSLELHDGLLFRYFYDNERNVVK